MIKFIKFLKTKYLFWTVLFTYAVVVGIVWGLFIPVFWGYCYGWITGIIAGILGCLKVIFNKAEINVIEVDNTIKQD